MQRHSFLKMLFTMLAMLGVGYWLQWRYPKGVIAGSRLAPGDDVGARFELAYRPGASFVEEDPKTQGKQIIPLVVQEASKLNLPSGRLNVADISNENFEVERRFPAGRYPVAVAHYPGDRRNALAMLRISDRAVARWTKASCTMHGKRTGCSFEVDSGSAAFGSVEAWKRDIEFLRNTPEAGVRQRIDEEVEVMMANRAEGADFADLLRDPVRQLNLIRVGTGFGDGSYGIYLGFDAKGEPVAVGRFAGLAKRRAVSPVG